MPAHQYTLCIFPLWLARGTYTQHMYVYIYTKILVRIYRDFGGFEYVFLENKRRRPPTRRNSIPLRKNVCLRNRSKHGQYMATEDGHRGPGPGPRLGGGVPHRGGRGGHGPGPGPWARARPGPILCGHVLTMLGSVSQKNKKS